MVNGRRCSDCDQNGRRLVVVTAQHLTGRVGLHDRHRVVVLVAFVRRRRFIKWRRYTFDFGFDHRLVMDQRLCTTGHRYFLFTLMYRCWLLLLLLLRMRFRPAVQRCRCAAPRPVTGRSTDFRLSCRDRRPAIIQR